jgi:hypothetical protein
MLWVRLPQRTDIADFWANVRGAWHKARIEAGVIETGCGFRFDIGPVERLGGEYTTNARSVIGTACPKCDARRWAAVS